MPEHLFLQRKDARTEGVRSHRIIRLAVDLHTAVHRVDQAQQLRLGAQRPHRRAELRLAVVGEDQVLQQHGFFLRYAQLLRRATRRLGAQHQMPQQLPLQGVLRHQTQRGRDELLALAEIMELCEGKDVSVNMISKSGTTTEPAIAFRVFREMLEKKYGKEGARERIYCTTDKAKGTLKALADEEGYETFVVPDDVGGRYSVLTAVGLLPIAAAGCDIDSMMKGAADAREQYTDPDLEKNDCYKYAAARNILYRKGKAVEMMVSYEPDYTMMNEWFKQLFGESEGKDGKGLFPSSAIFSTDLHSMGQYIQQGERLLFETAVVFDKPKHVINIEADAENADGLNFLAGKTMDFVNEKAFQGTVLAHCDGGVPNIILELPEMNEYEFGYLVYFLEKACAVSGYTLGVNPFNQPGVESYKKNMFALLGKPGYEAQKGELEKRLAE